jgi:hypothetical protein
VLVALEIIQSDLLLRRQTACFQQFFDVPFHLGRFDSWLVSSHGNPVFVNQKLLEVPAAQKKSATKGDEEREGRERYTGGSNSPDFGDV